MLKSLKILAAIAVTLSLIFILYANQSNLQGMVITVTKNPRVLCLVTTSPKDHKTKATAVSETWGARCDHLLFVSSQKERGLPIIDVKCEKEDHNHLWCKNRKGIQEAHKRFEGQYDWFMKADDDTYVVMENLKNLVGKYEPTDPVWFGCPFDYPGDHTKYYSGGAGYVMSHEAIVRLNKTWETPRKECDPTSETGADDLYLGSCFEKTGVRMGDESDELGRARFFPFSPSAWVNPRGDVYKTDWFKQYSIHRPNYKMGPDCCSDTSISFHYISPDDMYVFDFFLYRMKVKK